MIKIAILSLSIFLFSSCSLRYNPEAIPIARNLIFGAQDIKIDTNYYTNENASFAKIKFGRSYIIIPGLVAVNNNILSWETAYNEKIYTQNGKILSISGFDFDSTISDFQEVKFSKDNDLKRAFNITFSKPSGFFNQKSEFSFYGQEEIDYLIDEKRIADIYHERVTTVGFKWDFVNKYWIDKESGLVLQSIQRIHPKLPEIKIAYYYKFSN